MNVRANTIRRISTRLRGAVTDPLSALRTLRYHVGLTPSQERHIFVVGPPRSGTSLVQQILVGHSTITSLDVETHFFLRWNLHGLHRVPADVMKPFLSRGRSVIEVFDLLASDRKARDNALFFLEKTPTHALRLPFLVRYFPNSRIVFVVRDGRDGYLSAQRNPRFDTRSLDAYATLWAQCVRSYLNVHSANVFALKYEELCQRPAQTVKALMTFLRLEIEDPQLCPTSVQRTMRRGLKGHERLSKPITPETVGMWRSALTPDMAHEFQRIAGRELRLMGYD